MEVRDMGGGGARGQVCGGEGGGNGIKGYI